MFSLQSHQQLWGTEVGDSEESIHAVELVLGVRFPEPLRVFLRQTQLRDANEIHLKPLEALRIEGDVLVFAQEQQGCWQWGLDLGTLTQPDPFVLSDFESRWQSDECRLDSGDFIDSW